MASPSDIRAPYWLKSSPLLLMLGLPHFVPLLGVYVLLGGKERGFQLMALGLAVTGLFVGFIQSLSVGPRALLITPLSFVLGYLPGPYLIFRTPESDALFDFDVVMLTTLLSATVCITAGQWVLSRRSSAPGYSPAE
jgi:hypothetical protein